MSGTSAARLRLATALLSAAACVAASFIAAGAWTFAIAVPLPGVLLGCFGPRPRGGWAVSLYLAAMATAVAAAALLGAPAFLVVPGAALSLAAWDLAAFSRALRAAGGVEGDGVEGDEEARRAFEKRHLTRLGQALALGLAVSGAGMLVSPTIPFWAMAALVVVDLACLGSVLRFLKR